MNPWESQGTEYPSSITFPSGTVSDKSTSSKFKHALERAESNSVFEAAVLSAWVAPPSSRARPHRSAGRELSLTALMASASRPATWFLGWWLGHCSRLAWRRRLILGAAVLSWSIFLLRLRGSTINLLGNRPVLLFLDRWLGVCWIPTSWNPFVELFEFQQLDTLLGGADWKGNSNIDHTCWPYPRHAGNCTAYPSYNHHHPQRTCKVSHLPPTPPWRRTFACFVEQDQVRSS